ncbi:Glucosidase 2 subunit beta [Balamuthia mandrillaris]
MLLAVQRWSQGYLPRTQSKRFLLISFVLVAFLLVCYEFGFVAKTPIATRPLPVSWPSRPPPPPVATPSTTTTAPSAVNSPQPSSFPDYLIRGIPSTKMELYLQDPFFCDDYKMIPLAWVNDDYCDCPDNGADEPGTSACSKSRFYCVEPPNLYIPSSMVDDGICDCGPACCDEYHLAREDCLVTLNNTIYATTAIANNNDAQQTVTNNANTNNATAMMEMKVSKNNIVLMVVAGIVGLHIAGIGLGLWYMVVSQSNYRRGWVD